MTDNTDSGKSKLRRLQSEIRDMRLNVELELLPNGISVKGPPADKYLAKSELRRRKIKLSDPTITQVLPVSGSGFTDKP